MNNDKLAIAIGHSRNSKVWRNKMATWPKLVEKLKKPVITNELSKDYAKASREDRQKIKDVGGYVGGYLSGGRRKVGHVAHRRILTLDLDFAQMDFWDIFKDTFKNTAAVIHITHSHTTDTPKFRLIMPLSRECSSDEYVAVGRTVAGDLNVEYFDPTGFQPHRLMFWPSISNDAVYYFKESKGSFLDVDTVLSRYTDWSDSSKWPVSSLENDKVKSLTDKQENPENKKGIVGYFCRTFSITDALSTFLEDEYEPTALSNRFTYVKGSTSAGLVVYDDLFAYSHHGTDPTSGLLCNAFDLVRIHLFGNLDNTASHEGSTNTKSYKAMIDFASKNAVVKKLIAKEKILEVNYDFAEFVVDDDEDPEEAEWAIDLEVNNRGEYLSSANNINLILRNDVRLKNNFKYNLFDKHRYVCKAMPWRKIDGLSVIENVDYSGIRNYLESVYGITGSLKIDDALALEFYRNSFHPVKEYLLGLPDWDKTERIKTFLSDYLGCEQSDYSHIIFKIFLLGAIARIKRPGVKFDLVLTLVGTEGIGKSTIGRKLGGSYFSDNFNTIHGQKAFEQLQGAWIMEIAELSAFKKAEQEAVRHYISKQEDIWRPAFGKATEVHKRQCVFFATTNNPFFIQEPDAARRFMPIKVNKKNTKKDIHKIPASEVNQIWAEALELHKAGEKIYFDASLEEKAKKQRESYVVTDERLGLIEKYINIPLPENWSTLDLMTRQVYLDEYNPKQHKDGKKQRMYVCVAEIWTECLGKSKQDMTRYNTKDLNNLLRMLPGWSASKSTKNFKLYGKQRFYERDTNRERKRPRKKTNKIN